MLKLIVGLGNPGREYAATRHNAGFWFIEALARHLKVNFSFEGKYFAELGRAKVNGQDLWLLKPQTFMNLSGKAVQAVAGFYKILPEEILVVHDELDFIPGVSRLKFAGGAGGHNGLKDIERVLGKNYWRLRLGIGHPGDSSKVVGFVLTKPQLAEQIAIDLEIERGLKLSPLLINGDFARAQKQLHQAKAAI